MSLKNFDFLTLKLVKFDFLTSKLIKFDFLTSKLVKFNFLASKLIKFDFLTSKLVKFGFPTSKKFPHRSKSLDNPPSAHNEQRQRRNQPRAPRNDRRLLPQVRNHDLPLLHLRERQRRKIKLFKVEASFKFEPLSAREEKNFRRKHDRDEV